MYIIARIVIIIVKRYRIKKRQVKTRSNEGLELNEITEVPVPVNRKTKPIKSYVLEIDSGEDILALKEKTQVDCLLKEVAVNNK